MRAFAYPCRNSAPTCPRSLDDIDSTATRAHPPVLSVGYFPSPVLILERKKFFLRVADVYFCDRVDDLTSVDVAFLVQTSVPFDRLKNFRTLHIDLTQSEDELFSACSKRNRYQIRRAETKDPVDVRMPSEPKESETSTFLDFYDRFARSKHLPELTAYQKGVVRNLNAARALKLSRVVSSDGACLCHHSYITDDRRARLYHSASHYRELEDSSERALIGRANRYLHWRDILFFKHEGFSIYDFGGLTPGSTVHQNIDDFKMSFGGTPVTEFSGVRPMSALGRLGLRFLSRNS